MTDLGSTVSEEMPERLDLDPATAYADDDEPPELTPERLAGYFADLGVLGIVAGSATTMGLVHRWSWGLVGLGTLVCLGLALYSVEAPRLPTRWVTIPAALAAIASLAWLVPLPPALVGLLSPHTAQQWSVALEIGNVEPQWIPLHLAPGEGGFLALQGVVLCLFLGVLGLRSQDSEWSERMQVGLPVAILIPVLVSLYQTYRGDPFVLGVLHPPHGDPRDRFFTTLILKEHWLALMTAGILLAANQAMGPEQAPRRRFVAGVLAAALVASGVGVGGLPFPTGLIVGCLLLTLLRVLGELPELDLSEEDEPPSRYRRLGNAVLVLMGLAVAAGTTITVQSFSPSDAWRNAPVPQNTPSWTERWEQGLALVSDFPLVGVGRGALYDAHSQYQDEGQSLLLRWYGSWPLDLLSAFGAVVGLALIVLILWVLIIAVRAAFLDNRLAGVVAALIALALHDLNDFSSQLGVLSLVLLILAVVALSGEREGAPIHRVAWLGGFGTLLLSILLLVPTLPHWDASKWMSSEERATIRRERQWRDVAHEAARWHPVSFPNALAIAAGLAGDGDPEQALRWLGRAQSLAPKHALPHILTARLLYGTGHRQQALVEYHLAIHKGWGSYSDAVFREVARSYPEEKSLLEVLPRDLPEAAGKAAFLLMDDEDPRAVAVAAHAYEQSPEGAAAQVAGAFALLEAGNLREAADLLMAVWRRDDLSGALRLRVVLLMGRTDRPEDELRMLRGVLRTTANPGPWLWLRLSRLEEEQGDFGASRVALREVRTLGNRKASAESLYQEARMENSLGRPDMALQLVSRAVGLDRDHLKALVLKARIHQRLGQRAQARRALDSAVLLDPQNPESKRLWADWDLGPTEEAVDGL